MTHLSTWFASLLAVAITAGLSGGVAATPDAPAEFRIMSEQEMAAHSAMMRSLQGSARDNYRDAQYRQLRQRALQHGYRMPAAPPWAATDAPPITQSAVATPDPLARAAAEAADRHAAMREKLKALGGPLEAAPSGSASPPRPALPASATPDPTAPAQDTPQVETPAAAPAPGPPAAAAVPAPTHPERTQPRATVTPEPAPQRDTTTARFAPPEETVTPQAISTESAITAATATAGPERPYAGAGPDRAAHASSDAMTAYREAMRARFDQYMQQRQARHAESVRRQREQLEAGVAQNRQRQVPYAPYQPPPPALPPYAPGYPTGFPGYPQPYRPQR